MSTRATAALALALLAARPAAAAPPELAELDRLVPSLDALYQELHRNPELSGSEVRTAATIAARLRDLGFEVSEQVGGHGVVGVLRNGAGPTVLVRTDLDALPVAEETGLPYASTATAAGEAGAPIPVMHACGHDMHMASFVGAATLLAHGKQRWHGTLLFVGQPAEETLSGARAMLGDGLVARFPRPSFAVAQHVTALVAAGQVAVIQGPAMAASSAVDITFYGKGGHGATPHRAIDPVVMAARAVVTLQTIVSREVDPLDAAVVTVGTFHAGRKRNVIPDEAKLELTVRSFKPEVQKHLLAAIERIARAEAAAAGAPRAPLVTVDPAQASEVVENDPALAARLTSALRRGLGDASVIAPFPPFTSSEDFGLLGKAARAPSVMLALGAAEPGALARARAAGTLLPGPHSARFAPDRERTLRTGVAALTLAVLEILRR